MMPFDVGTVTKHREHRRVPVYVYGIEFIFTMVMVDGTDVMFYNDEEITSSNIDGILQGILRAVVKCLMRRLDNARENLAEEQNHMWASMDDLVCRLTSTKDRGFKVNRTVLTDGPVTIQLMDINNGIMVFVMNKDVVEAQRFFQNNLTTDEMHDYIINMLEEGKDARI